MGNSRQQAIGDFSLKSFETIDFQAPQSAKDLFGIHVFSKSVMEKSLPVPVYENVCLAMNALEPINPAFADTIALAMKEWAVAQGATHYTHWFQPLTGASAEKHDSFIDFCKNNECVIEQFSGNQLIQGEPDASSFPSGGLRSTYEARGYTGWDPTSPVFLWKAAGSVTLCIPSVFFSWTGEALDAKIPLLRSDLKLHQAALRLLRLTGINAKSVYSTIGLEQEYFVIDRVLRNLRPDLLILGKTVFGASPPMGQELQDHYLGSVKDRILAFMSDFETEALKLGIPVKTRHNEVAPAQHEVAPLFEKASKAIDHNLLLMELMRHTAVKHRLSCLLNEKPFKGLNGSGKHSNWSLSTDSGLNLLDPSETPGDNLHFLILLTAILHAIHRHSALLRASIGSYPNDARLGGHEAPPAIISVYLGTELEAVLEGIEKNGFYSSGKGRGHYDLGSGIISHLKQDSTDRNRTSPFAFTGNKFEFRAVGSSSNPAFPATVLNTIVADSLNEILDLIEKEKKKPFLEAAIPVLQKYLKISKPIRFSGDNYSKEWKAEAKTRGLPDLKKALEAFPAYQLPATRKAFQEVLSQKELDSRYEVAIDSYLHHLKIEINLMLEMFSTQILPAALEYQANVAKSILSKEAVLGKSKKSEQTGFLKILNELIEKGIKLANALKREAAKSLKGDRLKSAVDHVDRLEPMMHQLREIADELEEKVEDGLWPLPKYRELLFLV